MAETTSIRPFEEGDAQPIYESIQESGEYLSRWLPGINSSLSLEEIRHWIVSTKSEWDEGSAYHFVIMKEGSVVGASGLTHVDSGHLFANLYYWVRKSQAGQGIAADIVPQVAKFGFEKGLQRVEILVALGNDASIRVAEKAGAVREGLLRNRIRIGSQVHDAVMFSMIPEDLGMNVKGGL